MRPRAAAAVACRIIALVLGVQIVTQSISVLIIAGDGLGGTGRFWAIMGATAAIAWILWRAAAGLSASMTGGIPDEATASPRPTANIPAVALSIVGVLQIVQAIPDLVGVAASGGVVPGGFGPLTFSFGEFPFFDRGALVAMNVVRIALGVLVIMGAGQLSRSLARFYPDPEPPTVAPQPPGA